MFASTNCEWARTVACTALAEQGKCECMFERAYRRPAVNAEGVCATEGMQHVCIAIGDFLDDEWPSLECHGVRRGGRLG